MFEYTPPAQIEANPSNHIGAPLTISGNLRSAQDLRVSGRVGGSVHCEGYLFVAEGALIEGAVEARIAHIAGQVRGAVRAGELLILEPSSHVQGEIRARKLLLQTGARWDSACTIAPLNPA